MHLCIFLHSHATVSADATLLSALQHGKYIVTGGIPSFVVIPRDSGYRTRYFEQFKGVRNI